MPKNLRLPVLLANIFLAAFTFAEPAFAAGAVAYPNQTEGDFTANNFKFEDGETLPEVRLHYITLGTPQRDQNGHISNAVLLLHGTSSTSKSFFNPSIAGELFGAGQPLDASKFYIIVPDGLGRGGSSKPSDGLRAHFPHYDYTDVVAGQHLLVTEGLGIDHFRLVLGLSMGCMHTWMWAEKYPDVMDAVMPLACQPIAISGRNYLFRHILTEAIRHDPNWNGGDYQTPPHTWLETAPLWRMMQESPVKLQADGPTAEAALELYDKMREKAAKDYDPNDFLYWVESGRDYNPEPDLGKIKAQVLALNFADDPVNPADLEGTERLVKTIPSARFVLVPEGPKTNGHLSLDNASLWAPYLAELLRKGMSEGRSQR